MKITTNNATGEIVLYPNHEPTRRPGVTIREVEGIPSPDPGKRVIWDNEANDFAQVDLPPKPLRERLKAVTASFPAPVRAAFSQGFIAVNYWLGEGDEEAAKAVIEGVDVAGYPQEIQDAKAALLAEFGA